MKAQDNDINTELRAVTGELIKTRESQTDMEGHLEFLEDINGGPL